MKVSQNGFGVQGLGNRVVNVFYGILRLSKTCKAMLDGLSADHRNLSLYTLARLLGQKKHQPHVEKP